MSGISQETWEEIIKSDKPKTVNVTDIKVKCYDFALQASKVGIYQPDEVMNEAKKIFDWVMDNEGFEKQT